MASWATPNQQDILDEYKATYRDATSKTAGDDVLTKIAKKLKEGGKKGLPKKLHKV
jgi:hypothetical protein